jgi:hypothetical protein
MKQTVCFRCPVEIVTELDERADREGCTRTDLIVSWLEVWCDTDMPRPPLTTGVERDDTPDEGNE